MRCPYCSHDDTRVIDSRLGEGGEYVRRRRNCPDCKARFSTLERVVLEMPQVIKRTGAREKFDEDKLRLGMSRALEKRPIDPEAVEGAVNRVMRQFAHKGNSEIEVAEIGEAVMLELSALDEIAYVRFASVYRRFQDVDAFSDEVVKLKETLSSQPNEAQDSVFNGKGKEKE